MAFFLKQNQKSQKAFTYRIWCKRIPPFDTVGQGPGFIPVSSTYVGIIYRQTYIIIHNVFPFLPGSLNHNYYKQRHLCLGHPFQVCMSIMENYKTIHVNVTSTLQLHMYIKCYRVRIHNSELWIITTKYL